MLLSLSRKKLLTTDIWRREDTRVPGDSTWPETWTHSRRDNGLDRNEKKEEHRTPPPPPTGET